jgi:hypothetical protein
MTVQTTAYKTSIQGNGLTTIFSYGFEIPNASSVTITYVDAAGVSTVLPASQYTITGLGATLGGTVTYPLTGAPIATGTYLVIERTVPYKQLTSLTDQGAFYPAVVEAALDNLEFQIQQIGGNILNARAIVYPVTDVSPVVTLPVASQRANKIFAWDGAGNPSMVASPPAPPPTITNVFSYMTVAQIFSVQARNFSVNVTSALATAFAAGVGLMPPGGYLCSTTLTSNVNGIQIQGSGAAVTEMRFAAGQDGLTVNYTDPATPPSVLGLTITTLNPGPGVANTGLQINMSPLVGTTYRQGPRTVDVCVRGANPTTQGWSKHCYFSGSWYTYHEGLTLKGYSAVGAAQNTYESLYGIHYHDVMVPTWGPGVIQQHINTCVYEDGSTLACEGMQFTGFEFVGCNTGFSIGNGVASPIPGGVISDGHIDCSFRGIVLNNRVQAQIDNVLVYRTISTSLAWLGVLLSACDENQITNVTGANVSADTTACSVVWIGGTSKRNTVSGIISENFANTTIGAGANLVLADSASSNRADVATFVSGMGYPNANPALVGAVLVPVALAAPFAGSNNRIECPDAAVTTLTQNLVTPSVDNSLSGEFITNNNAPTSYSNFLNAGLAIPVTGSAGGTITTLTVGGVEVLGAVIAWAVSDANFATLIAAQINTFVSVPECRAIANGNVVTLQTVAAADLAVAGTTTGTARLPGQTTFGAITLVEKVRGYLGQTIRILVNDANTTFANGTYIVMPAAASQLGQSGDLYTFKLYTGPQWRLVGVTDHVQAYLNTSSISQMSNSVGGFKRVPGAGGTLSTTNYNEDASGNATVQSEVTGGPTRLLSNFTTDANCAAEYFDKYRGTIAAPAAAVVNDYVKKGIFRARNAAGTMKEIARDDIVLTKAESANEFGSTRVFDISKAGTGLIEVVRHDETGNTWSLRDKQKQGADIPIPIGNDLTLGYDGNSFDLTGNNQLNRIASADWQAGSVVTLFFTGTPTVKHGIASGGGFVSIMLNGSVDFVAAANGRLTLRMRSDSRFWEISRAIA